VETNKDLLEIFKKVKIIISMLDTIKQIPKNANLFKELYTYKGV